MPRYLIELQLPSETKSDFARLARVVRSALIRMDDGTPRSSVDCIGLVSNGHRTYCVVQAISARRVTKLMQTAMLPSRILRINELDPKRC